MRTPLRRFSSLPTSGLLLVAVTVANVAAQEADDFRSNARMRIGAVYLTPSLTLTNLGVDTNVFNESETDESSADFVVSLEPRSEVWVPFGRQALWETSAAVELDYYQRFASERSLNPNLSTRFSYFTNRLSPWVGGRYLNSRQRPNLEIDIRSRRVEDGLSAGFDLELFSKLSLAASGRYDRTRHDADAFFENTSLAETLNRDERTGRLAVRWRRNALLTVVVAGEAETARFQLSPERDSDSERLTVGAELNPRALISGSATVGVRRFHGLSATLPDFQGFVASGRVSYTWSGSTVFTYSIERDLEYSFRESQPYYVLTGHGLEVVRHLAGSFDVTVGIQRDAYDYRRFRLGFVPSSETRGSTEVTWRGRTSIDYRLNRDTRVGLGVSYSERQSASDGRRYNGLRLGMMLSYGST